MNSYTACQSCVYKILKAGAADQALREIKAAIDCFARRLSTSRACCNIISDMILPVIFLHEKFSYMTA